MLPVCVCVCVCVCVQDPDQQTDMVPMPKIKRYNRLRIKRTFRRCTLYNMYIHNKIYVHIAIAHIMYNLLETTFTVCMYFPVPFLSPSHRTKRRSDKGQYHSDDGYTSDPGPPMPDDPIPPPDMVWGHYI